MRITCTPLAQGCAVLVEPLCSISSLPRWLTWCLVEQDRAVQEGGGWTLPDNLEHNLCTGKQTSYVVIQLPWKS